MMILVAALALLLPLAVRTPGARAFDQEWDSGHNTTERPEESDRQEKRDRTSPPEDPCKDATGSPVYMRTGNLVLGFTDLEVKGGPIPLEVHRQYNSQEVYNGPFGHGWTSTNAFQLAKVIKNNTVEQVIVRRELGQRTTFQHNPDGTYSPLSPGSYDALADNGDGTFTLNPPCATCGGHANLGYRFNAAGFVDSVRDANGNSLTLTYDGKGRLAGVADGQGHALTYAYGPNDKVASVSDGAGRTVHYGYDANDNLTAVTDPAGATVRYAYDADHNLLSLTDARGGTAIEATYDNLDRVATYAVYGKRVAYTYGTALSTTRTDLAGRATTFSYNDKGVITRVDYSDGSHEEFAYDGKLNLLSYKDGRGFITAYTYDEAGRKTSVTNALGGVTRYAYDGATGRLQSETSPRGVVTTYEHNERGNVTRKVMAAGTPEQIEERWTYDAAGRRLTHTDGAGGTTAFAYDGSGRLLTVTDPGGSVVETNVYDEAGNRVSKTDAHGAVTRYAYDAKGRVIAVTDALGFVTRSEYDGNGNLVASTDGNGNTTRFEYNLQNKRIKVVDPLGNVSETGYDERGLPVWTRDPLGHMVLYQYGHRNRLARKIVKVGDRDATPDADDLVTEYEYDASGNVVRQTDPGGNAVTSTYDGLGRLLTRTLPMGEQVRFTYDEAGNLTRKAAATGLVVEAEYDPLNRVRRVFDSLGTIRRYTRDGRGKTLTLTTGSGSTTNLAYDARGKLLRRTYPDGTYDAVTYEAAGRTATVADRGGRTVAFSYDALGRIISATDGLGHRVSATYDARRKLTLTDGSGNVTSYKYDGSGNVLRETYADGSSVAYAYDAAGRMVSKTTPGGALVRFEYDDGGRLARRDYPGDHDDVFTYSPGGALLSAVNADATVTRAYDADGRMVGETVNGRTVTYQYDIASRTRTITYPGGRVVREFFDERERPVALRTGEGADLFTFAYGPGNARTGAAAANGVRARFDYSGFHRIAGLTWEKDGAGILDEDYRFSASGRLSAVDDLVRGEDSVRYDYDGADRLVAYRRGTPAGDAIPAPVRKIEYALDGADNLTAATVDGAPEPRTVNSLNAYTAVGAAAVIHDADGNLADDGEFLYRYDVMNRLVEVRRKSDGISVALYKYDALGRRVSTDEGGNVTTYHYDMRFRVIEEQRDGATAATFVFGPEQDEVLQMERGGQVYYFHADPAGNVRVATDAAGAVVERYRYDPYGRVSFLGADGAPRGASAIGNPFLFKGKRYDAATGLYYFRARYLSPSLGRFITRDPVGYDDGLNLYAFAHQDPVNFDDYFGLEGKEECTLELEGKVNFDDLAESFMAFKRKFDVGGEVSLKSSSCTAKCCKRQISYRKWELEANFKMSYEGVWPTLGIDVPSVGKFGLIYELTFGIRGSGQLSETFDSDCNVTCANEICVGVYGELSLMLGAKTETWSGEEDDETGVFGAEFGIKGAGELSGKVCYGCEGWKAEACLGGKIELVSYVKLMWLDVGGTIELWEEETCTSKSF